jgi:amidase
MFRTVLCLAVLCLALATPALANETVTITGPWIITFTIAGESHSVRATLNQAGDVVTGELPDSKLNGTFKEGQIEITMSNEKGHTQGKLNGVLRDGKLTGSGMLFGHTLESWIGARPASAPSSPQTHKLEASSFPRYLSTDVKPAIRVFSGDTVRTVLIDEDGRDENEKTRALSGIPVVGPIYVENALPGDMIAIRLNKIRINRETAESGHHFVGAATDPEYLHNAKEQSNFDANWKLDKATGTARLAKPSAGLSSLALSIQPMIGIIGVAPPGRQIVLAKGGGDNFGGHLDYNEIVEGTTVYLPVFHEGAGLFLGDGHALQGDGQVSGEGLETSLDVHFTVTVVPKKAFHIPYAENATELMFIGVGGSVEQALQRATAGLAAYLEQEYKLNSTEAATLLGAAGQYRIAKVAAHRNEPSTVVAKISKSVLQQLKKTP